MKYLSLLVILLTFYTGLSAGQATTTMFALSTKVTAYAASTTYYTAYPAIVSDYLRIFPTSSTTTLAPELLRSDIVNGTSVILTQYTSTVNIGVPSIYGAAAYDVYTGGNNAYVGYSYHTMRRSMTFTSSGVSYNSAICGGLEYVLDASSPTTTAHGYILCYTPSLPCASAPVFGKYQHTTVSNISAGITSQYIAISPTAFLSSEVSTGMISPSQNNFFLTFYYYSSTENSPNIYYLDIRNMSATGLLQFAALQTLSSPTYLVSVPYNDYETSGQFHMYTYVATSSTSFTAYQVRWSTPYTAGWFTKVTTISGYSLLNHYSYADGVTVPLPVFVMTDGTSLILATATGGFLNLTSGLTTLTSAPVVGCVPDRGTMINWNNLANPYPNTVHLYTMCNYVVGNTTAAATGAVYEIAITATSLTFTRWQTLPIYTAVSLSVIGEYHHILTTSDTAATPAVTTTPGLYALYDPYNPIYIGYATLDPAQNPANTVAPNYGFAIATDITDEACGYISGNYVVAQYHTGIDTGVLAFCGSGNTQWNNISYCDGPGLCCSDFCQYDTTSNATCVAAMNNICIFSYCVAGNVDCQNMTAPNGTDCSKDYGCAPSSQCYSTVCVPNGTLPANTPCGTSPKVPMATCSIATQVCNGTSPICQNTTPPTACVVQVDATCNLTGTCDGGNCLTTGTCPFSSTTTVDVGKLGTLPTTSYTPKTGAVVGTSVAVAVFGAVILLFIFVINVMT